MFSWYKRTIQSEAPEGDRLQSISIPSGASLGINFERSLTLSPGKTDGALEILSSLKSEYWEFAERIFQSRELTYLAFYWWARQNNQDVAPWKRGIKQIDEQELLNDLAPKWHVTPYARNCRFSDQEIEMCVSERDANVMEILVGPKQMLETLSNALPRSLKLPVDITIKLWAFTDSVNNVHQLTPTENTDR